MYTIFYNNEWSSKRSKLHIWPIVHYHTWTRKWFTIFIDFWSSSVLPIPPPPPCYSAFWLRPWTRMNNIILSDQCAIVRLDFAFAFFFWYFSCFHKRGGKCFVGRNNWNKYGQIRGFHTNMLAISNASLIRKCIHCVGSFLQCAKVYSIHCK